MPATAQDTDEWIDGFLFVGNRLILDFLNTNPVLATGPVELLPDPHALERWLIAADLVPSPRHRALLRTWRNSTRAAAFLRQLIAFRERLRAAVVRIEKGLLPSAAFVAEVNALARQYPLHTVLSEHNAKLVHIATFDPRQPEDFWAPIVAATAELLAHSDPARLRQCESCVVHFLDISKKGSRRWCSMNLCGNKVKVAAYQKRQRDRGERISD